MEVAQMRHSQSFELRREPRQRNLKSLEPHPARLESAPRRSGCSDENGFVQRFHRTFTQPGLVDKRA